MRVPSRPSPLSTRADAKRYELPRATLRMLCQHAHLFSELLTHGQVVVDTSSAIAFGCVAASWVISPYLTNVALMAVGRVRVIALSAAVGVPFTLALLASAELVGLAGLAPWAIVIGNSFGMAWLALSLRHAMSSPSEPELTYAPTLEPVP